MENIVTGRLHNSTHLFKYRHHTFAGLNLHSEEYNLINHVEDAAALYKPFPYEFKCPLPLNVKNEVYTQDLNGYNKVLELPKRKYFWRRKKRAIMKKFRSVIVKNKNISRAIGEIKKCPDTISNRQPSIFAMLGHHLSNNPDEYFKCNYNWYFGNGIACTTVNNKHFFLSICGNNFNKIGVHRYKIKKVNYNDENLLRPEVKNSSSFHFEENKPIYDIISSRTSDLIGVRQRDACYFFRLSEDVATGDLFTDQCCSVQNKGYSFTSIDSKGEEFCTASVNGIVKLWSPDYSMQCISQIEVPVTKFKHSDSFMSAKYGADDPNIISVINRSSFFSFDKRTDLRNPSYTCKFHEQTESCEEVSLLLPSSKDSNYWYVGLTHSLFLLDFRSGKVQKWIHMLPSAPNLGCIQKTSSGENWDELIHLACQCDNNISCVCNSWSDNVPSSYYVPLSVPSTLDTLLCAKSNGACLNPALNYRFGQNIIGLTPYKRKEQMGLFMSMSNGDIFYQRIMTKNILDADNDHCDRNIASITDRLDMSDLHYLTEWEDSCFKMPASTIVYCTDVVDMREIFDHINVNDINYTSNETNHLRQSKWKISKKELETYNDLLACNIIDDFDIRDEVEWESDDDDDDDDDILPSGGHVKSVDKVNSWLSNFPLDTSVENERTEQLPEQDEELEDEENSDVMSVELQ